MTAFEKTDNAIIRQSIAIPLVQPIAPTYIMFLMGRSPPAGSINTIGGNKCNPRNSPGHFNNNVVNNLQVLHSLFMFVITFSARHR